MYIYIHRSESSKIPLLNAESEIQNLNDTIIQQNKTYNTLQNKYNLLQSEKEAQMTETQKAEKKVQNNLNIIIEHNKIELELNNNIKLLNNDILVYKKNIRTLEIENDKLRSEIMVKGQNYGKPRVYMCSIDMFVYLCLYVLTTYTPYMYTLYLFVYIPLLYALYIYTCIHSLYLALYTYTLYMHT